MNVFFCCCCFVSQKISSSIPLLLVMLLAHVGKRSNNRSQMFSKAVVLKNLAIFTGKNLCWNLFLVKFHDSRPAFLFKKESSAQLLFCEYCEIFKSNFCIEDLFIIPFQNFYLMIDTNWYFRVIFYYRKIGHVTERTSQ